MQPPPVAASVGGLVALVLLALPASADEPTGSDPAPGFRWSQSVLEAVLEASGVKHRAAVLRRAAARDNGDRYLNRGELEAAARAVSRPRLGVVSDIDRTVLPHHEGKRLPGPFPGVVALFRALEASDGEDGDVFYVTARTHERIAGLAAWMERHGLPEGPIEPGRPAIWQAGEEKAKDIAAIFAERPELTFVLFGDTSHRDPEAYADLLRRHPDRIAAVVIRKATKTVGEGRTRGMLLVEDYAEAAAALHREGIIDRRAARAVIDAARAEGLAIRPEIERALGPSD